jgi:hypothetical protein
MFASRRKEPPPSAHSFSRFWDIAGHRTISAIRERILEVVDVTRAREDDLPAMSAIEVLRRIGVDQPSNPQCKEANSALRELLGEPKRIHGINKWRVPFRQEPTPPQPAVFAPL